MITILAKPTKNMGNGLFRRLWGKQQVRILFVGLYASGKTTVMYRLKLGEVVTTIPTIGFNVETIEQKNVTIMAWDVGGRDKVRPLYRHYYSSTQGLVYCFDSSDKDRFKDAMRELERISCEDELEGIPFLVLANKQDLTGSLSVEETRDKLAPLFKNRPWAVFGVSATYGKDLSVSGLIEAFDWLSNAIVTKESYHVMRKWLPEGFGEYDDDKEEESKQNDAKGVSGLKMMGSFAGAIKSMLSDSFLSKILRSSQCRR